MSTLLDRRRLASTTSSWNLNPNQIFMDQVQKQFSHQAADPIQLASMFTASWVGQLSALGSARLLRYASLSNFATKIFSGTASLIAEAGAYQYSSRKLEIEFRNASSELLEWNGSQGFKNGFYHSLLGFGAIKTAQAATFGQNLLFQHSIENAAFVVSNYFAETADIIPRSSQNWIERWTEAEAFNFAQKAAYSLVPLAFPTLTQKQSAMALESKLSLHVNEKTVSQTPAERFANTANSPLHALAISSLPEGFIEKISFLLQTSPRDVYVLIATTLLGAVLPKKIRQPYLSFLFAVTSLNTGLGYYFHAGMSPLESLSIGGLLYISFGILLRSAQPFFAKLDARRVQKSGSDPLERVDIPKLPKLSEEVTRDAALSKAIDLLHQNLLRERKLLEFFGWNPTNFTRENLVEILGEIRLIDDVPLPHNASALDKFLTRLLVKGAYGPMYDLSILLKGKSKIKTLVHELTHALHHHALIAQMNWKALQQTVKTFEEKMPPEKISAKDQEALAKAKAYLATANADEEIPIEIRKIGASLLTDVSLTFLRNRFETIGTRFDARVGGIPTLLNHWIVHQGASLILNPIAYLGGFLRNDSTLTALNGYSNIILYRIMMRQGLLNSLLPKKYRLEKDSTLEPK